MENYNEDKRAELIETCQDLRLAVSGNEKLNTLRFYIQAAYDEYQEFAEPQQSSNKELLSESKDEEINYGKIGDKKWIVKYWLNKILFFI